MSEVVSRFTVAGLRPVASPSWVFDIGPRALSTSRIAVWLTSASVLAVAVAWRPGLAEVFVIVSHPVGSADHSVGSWSKPGLDLLRIRRLRSGYIFSI
jgi:hypothetical protein